MQIVGRHHNLQVADIAAEVQIAGPPAFVAHVHDAPQFDLLAVVGKSLDTEVARHDVVLRTAFQFEGVEAGGQVQGDLAGEDKVVGPEGKAFDLLGPPTLSTGCPRTTKVQSTGDRLLGLGIDDGQKQLAVGRAGGRRLKQKNGQADE